LLPEHNDSKGTNLPPKRILLYRVPSRASHGVLFFGVLWMSSKKRKQQEGQHPLTGQRAANFRLLRGLPRLSAQADGRNVRG